MNPEPSSTFKLQSRRLHLRQFVASDASELSAMHQDARINAHLFDEPALANASICAAFLERLELFYRHCPGLGLWHASLPADDHVPLLAGWFSLLPMPGEASAIELGGRLAPAAWGRSIGIEGGIALLTHAFTTLSLDAVWGTCHPENRPAKLILTALDFQFAGVRDYDGNQASHYCLSVNRWCETAHLSAGKRLRRTVAASRASTAEPVPQS